MKIVRDKIPDLHARGELGQPASGVDRSRQTFRQATPEEYRLLLLAKLAEEVGEVVSAMTREQRLEELNDLSDVIDQLKALDGYTRADATARLRKRHRFGGFAEGWVLEWKEGTQAREGYEGKAT